MDQDKKSTVTEGITPGTGEISVIKTFCSYTRPSNVCEQIYYSRSAGSNSFAQVKGHNDDLLYVELGGWGWGWVGWRGFNILCEKLPWTSNVSEATETLLLSTLSSQAPRKWMKIRDALQHSSGFLRVGTAGVVHIAGVHAASLGVTAL